MGLFNRNKSSELSRGNSWIPDAIEFELGNETNNNQNNDANVATASSSGASNLEASISSAFLLDGVRRNDESSNNSNSRRPPPPPPPPPPPAKKKSRNPFDTLEYASSSDEEEHVNKTPSRQDHDAMKSSKAFEADMKEYEAKLSAIDNANFHHFNDEEDDDDSSNSSSAPLSGIEEGSGEASNAKSSSFQRGRRKSKGSTTGSKLKSFFGRKSKSSSKLQYADDEEGSYISGEYDEEFDNQYGIPSPNDRSSNNNNNNNALAIGVPGSKGRKMTIGQLEDQLYLYKLETLNLTDACRELSDQLEETEQKLESVQAQATFRIHALEAELQDGNIGLKSLVKMTSTEMDGRLDALRALGKTATIQADKLKRREHELQNVEQQLRRTRRDIKTLKRENKKVVDEKDYLTERLNEVEVMRDELQHKLNGIEMDQVDNIERVNAEGKAKVDEYVKKLNERLEEVALLKSQIELKEKEIGELKEQLQGKDEEIVKMKDSLDMKGELLKSIIICPSMSIDSIFLNLTEFFSPFCVIFPRTRYCPCRTSIRKSTK